jgi:hypothetical protein
MAQVLKLAQVQILKDFEDGFVVVVTLPLIRLDWVGPLGNSGYALRRGEMRERERDVSSEE